MKNKKKYHTMKRLYLVLFTYIIFAINLGIALAQFWKPNDIEHPLVCFIIWVITEIYLIFFVYVNVFDKKSIKNILIEEDT